MFRKNKLRLLDKNAWKYGNDDYKKDAYMACAFETSNCITYATFIASFIKMLIIIIKQ